MQDHGHTQADAQIAKLERLGTSLELSLKRHVLANPEVKSAIAHLAEEIDLARHDDRFQKMRA